MPPPRLLSLPERWFDRRQYRPRVPAGGAEGGRWFLLAAPELASPRAGASEVRAAALLDRSARAALVEAIEATYRGWSLPRAAEADRGLAALRDEGTVCVVTGQQPGFLGGPLLTLYKALAAISLAAKVEADSGRRCVPVFWVAGEDHDVDEIRTARFPTPGGGDAEFALPHPSGRAPVSSLAVDAATERVLDDAAAHFDGWRAREDATALLALYRGRTVVSGFAAILASLLGKHGLIIADPERLRPLARPLVRRVLAEPEEALARVEEGAREVEARGLPAFVAPRLPLFILREGRRDHLSPAPGGLRIDGEGGVLLPRGELLELLDSEPERFSSGALLRPLVQQALFPCVRTVGGPAEAGYFAQLAPLCRWLGLEPPRLALRFQATAIEGPLARAWEKLSLDPGKFAAAERPEDLVPPAAPIPALEALRGARETLARAAASLIDELPGAARGLERSARTARSALEKLIAKAEREERRSQELLFQAAERLWHGAFPGGALQERSWGWLYLVARRGSAWIDELLDAFRDVPLETVHHVVYVP